MKQNQRRTLVTVIGIIISVAMFSAVTTFASSFMKMLQTESEKSSGSWHVSYQNMDISDLELLKEDPNSNNISIVYYLDTMFLGTEEVPFSITAVSPETFSKEITLAKGNYPKNDNEIIIDPIYTQSLGLTTSIGDSLTFTNDTGTKTYQVVGFIDNCYLYTFPSIITYASNTFIESSQSISTFVTLHNVSNDIYQDSQEIADAMDISQDTILYNSNLVYYGVSSNDTFLTAMYTIILIIMSIIMIGSIVLIYNAFVISLSERSRQLGMLASIGATRNQKRYSVYYEGLFLGILAIPLGVIVGIGGLGVTFIIINPIIKDITGMNGFPLVVSNSGILLAVGFAIITILLSTYIPSRRASRISPMEAIRATEDIKITKRTIKTNRITKKLFGMEGELALKNLKRNKKRYYTTVISLIVSVILFLSVSSFTYYFQNAFKMSTDTLNYDAQLSIFDNDELYQQLCHIDHTTQIAPAKQYIIFSEVPITDLDPILVDIVEEDNFYNDTLPLTLTITAYDSKYMKSFYQEHNLEQNSVLINQSNIIPANRKFTESTILKEQKSSMSFSYEDYDRETDERSEHTLSLDNIVYTNDLPLGISQPRSYDYLEIIVPEAVFNSLPFSDEPTKMITYTTDNNKAMDQEINTIINQYDNPSFAYHNIQQEISNMEQIFFVINIFAYGFIILISLISITNIFNTITTSVSLRTREFAMLKSVGMTPRAFHKMISYESIFYGLHTLLVSIPISILIMYIMHHSLISVFNTPFSIPYINIIISIVAIFSIVSITLLFSTNKIRKQNIIDGLKTENI
jgi:putative ABC transport system permease protein